MYFFIFTYYLTFDLRYASLSILLCCEILYALTVASHLVNSLQLLIPLFIYLERTAMGLECFSALTRNPFKGMKKKKQGF